KNHADKHKRSQRREWYSPPWCTVREHRSKHEIHHGPHQLRGWSVRAYQPRRFGDTVVVQHVDKRVYPSRTNPDAQVGDSQRVPGIPDVLEESRLRAIAAGVACLPFRVPFNGVANKYRRIHLRG
ncbi:unnamed protein product, partial [Linum tenue]